jgi:hypothetical protein
VVVVIFVDRCGWNARVVGATQGSRPALSPTMRSEMDRNLDRLIDDLTIVLLSISSWLRVASICLDVLLPRGCIGPSAVVSITVWRY